MNVNDDFVPRSSWDSVRQKNRSQGCETEENDREQAAGDLAPTKTARWRLCFGCQLRKHRCCTRKSYSLRKLTPADSNSTGIPDRSDHPLATWIFQKISANIKFYKNRNSAWFFFKLKFQSRLKSWKIKFVEIECFWKWKKWHFDFDFLLFVVLLFITQFHYFVNYRIFFYFFNYRIISLLRRAPVVGPDLWDVIFSLGESHDLHNVWWIDWNIDWICAHIRRIHSVWHFVHVWFFESFSWKTKKIHCSIK